MPEIKEITVSRTCKCNLGNYESLDLFVSATAEVDTVLEDPEQALLDLSRQVEGAMSLQLYRSYKVRGKSIKPDEVCTRHGLTIAPKLTENGGPK